MSEADQAAESASEYRSPDHPWAGRSGSARRDNPSDNCGMGAEARPAGFVLRPLSRSAIRLIRERHRRPVCGLRAAGRSIVLAIPCRYPATSERAGHWQTLGLFDLKGAFRCDRVGFAPVLLGQLARQRIDEPSRTPAALTMILATIVWWSFLIGHVMNNIMGFEL